MTEREQLLGFYTEHERMPTYEEMKDLFNVASKNTVSYKIKKLIEEGVVKKEGRRFSLVDTGSVIRLGTVQAGFPTSAEEAEMHTISLDRMLIRKKGLTYMVEVMGESMKDAGIFEGDLVLVEKGKRPARGDIVLARVENEYTLKYFDLERGKPVLVPANKRFKKIKPDPESLRIEAVASAIIRKFK